MKTKEEFEAAVAAQRVRPDVETHSVAKTRCDVCWREQEARIDADGFMMGSCVFCGFKPGKYENYEVRQVEVRNGASKFEVTNAKRLYAEG